jgi:hypothetical protein
MFRRTLTAAAAVTLAVAATSLIPVATAQARPACGGTSWCLWSDYQDAAHTILIGEHGYDCSGKYFQTGNQDSRYVVFQILPC